MGQYNEASAYIREFPCYRRVDVEVILLRIGNNNLEQDEDSELEEMRDAATWSDLKKILSATVMDKVKDEGKRVGAALRSLRVQNELLHVEIDGLKDALSTKQRHKNKSTLLDLRDSEGKRGTGMIWSPRTVRRAAQHNEEKQRQEEEQQLQNARHQEE